MSPDKGVSWRPARLGKDLGNYSFREWSFDWVPPRKATYRLIVRAKNRTGESQPVRCLVESQRLHAQCHRRCGRNDGLIDGKFCNHDTETGVVSNRQGEIIGCLAVLGTAMVSFAQTTSIELPRDNPGRSLTLRS